MLLGMFDWIADFFKSMFDLVPKLIYLLYASMACVLDVLQLFFRKIAGLDVYYIEGEAVTGDLVTNFIAGIIGIKIDGADNTNYSALSTVFWAFIIFGVVICFASTFVAVIKSHYSYDDKSAKGPMQYVYAAGKAIINMAAVPIIVVVGLILSQAVLTAVDSITSVDSSAIENMYGPEAMQLLKKTYTAKGATGKTDETTYIYYDIFGYGGGILYGDADPAVKDWTTEDAKKLVNIGAKNQTFSGSLFKVAAYNANRARLGTMDVKKGKFTGAANSDFKLFAKAQTNDELADMIDMAFACNVQFEQGWIHFGYEFCQDDPIVSLKYFKNFLIVNANSFSKFNVGLVWYYYDLWSFNFIVGFGALMLCLTIFLNIIMGLLTRLFVCVALFLVAPPLFGLAPLDGGNAGKNWRQTFIKQVLMTYGAVIGMNIMFLILPFINRIDFFNIPIADYFVQALIIIVGLITIKALISTTSSLIGAEDANKTGEGIKEEALSTMAKAGTLTGGLALGIAKHTPAGLAMKGISKGISSGIKKGVGHFNGSNAKEDKEKADKNVKSAEKELELAKATGNQKEIDKAENRLKAAQTAQEKADNKFNSSKTQTRIAKAELKQAKKVRRANSAAGKAFASARGVVAGGFGKIVGAFSSVLTGDKALKAVKDTIWEPRDYAKETADNTGALNNALLGTKDKTTGKKLNGKLDDLQMDSEKQAETIKSIAEDARTIRESVAKMNKNHEKGDSEK